MKTLTQKKLLFYYDLNQYLYDNITYYSDNRDEFLEHIGETNRDYLKVEHKEIEDYFYKNNWHSEYYWEDFIENISYQFQDYIGKEVFVTCKNMTWRNLSGKKTFVIKEPTDIFFEIVPQTDLTFYLYKEDKDNYQAVITHHDSPMGETYNIKITDYEK